MSEPRETDPGEVMSDGRVPVRMWTRGVQVEEAAREQLRSVANMPFVFRAVAVMPDVHLGIGSTIGSVVPTIGAVMPAAVGVDIGCGMMACKTSLTASDVPPEVRPELRAALEKAVPHGRTDDGGADDRGAWHDVPLEVQAQWDAMANGYSGLMVEHPKLATRFTPARQLGTLGTGNHFLEVCLDTDDAVWVMLHSGSRGVGARIGGYFTKLAQEECARWFVTLPDKSLAYLAEGTPGFAGYLRAVQWAQEYARINRAIMMMRSLRVLRDLTGNCATLQEIDCHHNYVTREHHFGRDVLVTRKGAIRAREGDWGIIPGSMGARSFIVRGKGNPESFCSASHGAGRKMSRTEAKRSFTVEDHAAAVAGIECRLDADVLDETPGAYKSIDAVMAAQASMVEPVTELRQIVCVKG